MRRYLIVSIVILICTGLLSAQGPPKGGPSKVITLDEKVVSRCADPATGLRSSTNLPPGGGTGMISLSGSVCNRGTVDYTGAKPLVARYIAYTAHPPTGFAVEGQKILADIEIGSTLKKGECKDVNQTYQVPNVVSWGKPAANLPAGQVPARKMISLCVLKDKSAAKFTSAENCGSENDCSEVSYDYTEKT